MSPTEGLRVKNAPQDGLKLGKLRAGIQLLHLFALVCGVLALVYLAFAFWSITEAIAMAAGRRQGLGPLLPLVLATLGSWSIMYLLHDKLGILGSAKARTALLPRAEALYKDEAPLARHFVELRPYGQKGRKGPFKADWGWLLLFPDRLEFVGEQQCLTLERTLVAGPPRQESNTAGLLPTWLDLPVRADWKGMAMLCRDSARSLSDTQRDAEALQTALTGWLRKT
jgi:hypothetical protein